jgi:hypothetical protein
VRLKARFRELADSYELLRTASPIELQEAYRTREVHRGREILQREQVPIGAQLQPSASLGVQERRLMQATPSFGVDRPRRAEQATMARVGDQTVAQEDRQLAIAKAADRIGLDTNRLARLQSQTPTSDLERRLGEEARQLSQEAAAKEAEDAVRNIFQLIAERVLNAIQALLDLPMTSEVLPDLPKQLRNLTTTVEAWRDRHLKDSSWYQTALGKEEELAGLTAELVAATQPIRNLLDARRVEAERQQEELDQSIRETNSRIETLEEDVSGIDARLEHQLPQWLRGVVSVREMIQLYPFVVLALLVFIAINVAAVNRHHAAMLHIVRENGEVDHSSPLGSIWLLRQAEVGSRIASAAFYFGGLMLFWFLFEYGCAHLVPWLTIEPTGSLLGVNFVRSMMWTGRLVLFIAMIWLLLVTLRGLRTAPVN